MGKLENAMNYVSETLQSVRAQVEDWADLDVQAKRAQEIQSQDQTPEFNEKFQYFSYSDPSSHDMVFVDCKGSYVQVNPWGRPIPQDHDTGIASLFGNCPTKKTD